MPGSGETAAVSVGRESPFLGLARASGFSVRDCALAAASGRLAGIVKVAELRRQPAMTGHQALVRLRLLELRGRLLEG
jgi:hypothetical protein